MANYWAALLLSAAVLAASGCGGQTERTEGTAREADAEDTEKTDEEEEGTDGTEGTSIQTAELSEAGASAYRSVLEGIYYNHLFPGNQDYGFEDGGDVTTNKFAVFDVDQDGQQELIIFYETTTMAGKRFLIYDFEEALDTVREEFSEYPSVTFYDNGYVKADLSHNHGLASSGDFWPYTLYRYDAEGDTYTQIASVDAWEKAQSETDYEGNPFPDEADTSGAGIVYYVTPEGGEDTAPMDQAAYEAWMAEWMGDAQVLEIPFENLTEENIKNVK